MKKVLWVKFGWSHYYRGGPVDGNFGWLNEHRGQRDEGRGHEAFNFMPDAGGIYHCYVPPQAKDFFPWNDDNTGWTVVCLAKNPAHKGIHVVGWYENATLTGDWTQITYSAQGSGQQDEISPFEASYCITSDSAFFVSPDSRDKPFSDPSVRQGKYSFLAGPHIEPNENKERVLEILEGRLAALRGVAIHNPTEISAPDPETDPGDPLSGFGTPEHRKAVEMAAERAVVSHYQRKGFTGHRVATLNCGYDYIFSKGRIRLHVEVKGTLTTYEKFFMTKNENNYRTDLRWRLGMVTNALSEEPNVKIYDERAFRAAFDLEPYVLIGTRIVEPEDN